MARHQLVLWLGACGIWVGAFAPLRASDLPVNNEVSGYQMRAAVALTEEGTAFVVFDNEDEPPNPVDSVEGRFFGADDAPLGLQFRLSDSQWPGKFAAVAADHAGRFIVVWQRSGSWIGARRFQADGTPLGASFNVAEDGWPALSEAFPTIATAPGGGFAVAWITAASRVALQRFDADAAPLGPRILMPENGAAFTHDRADLAFDLQGNLAVAWRAISGSTSRLYWQRVAADGDLIGAPDRVDFANAAISGPVLLSDDAGNLVVAWIDLPSAGNPRAVFQRYSASGTAEGGNVVLLPNLCSEIAGASDGNGEGLLVLDCDVDASLASLVGIRLKIASGARVGDPFRVNSKNLQHGRPAVACSRAGACLAAWEEVDLIADPSVIDITRSATLPAGAIFTDGFESGDLYRWAP